MLNGGKIRISKPVLKKIKFHPSMASTVTSSPTNSGMSEMRVKSVNFGQFSGNSDSRVQKVNFNERFFKTVDLCQQKSLIEKIGLDPVWEEVIGLYTLLEKKG